MFGLALILLPFIPPGEPTYSVVVSPDGERPLSTHAAVVNCERYDSVSEIVMRARVTPEGGERLDSPVVLLWLKLRTPGGDYVDAPLATVDIPSGGGTFEYSLSASDLASAVESHLSIGGDDAFEFVVLGIVTDDRTSEAYSEPAALASGRATLADLRGSGGGGGGGGAGGGVPVLAGARINSDEAVEEWNRVEAAARACVVRLKDQGKRPKGAGHDANGYYWQFSTTWHREMLNRYGFLFISGYEITPTGIKYRTIPIGGGSTDPYEVGGLWRDSHGNEGTLWVWCEIPKSEIPENSTCLNEVSGVCRYLVGVPVPVGSPTSTSHQQRLLYSGGEEGSLAFRETQTYAVRFLYYYKSVAEAVRSGDAPNPLDTIPEDYRKQSAVLDLGRFALSNSAVLALIGIGVVGAVVWNARADFAHDGLWYEGNPEEIKRIYARRSMPRAMAALVGLLLILIAVGGLAYVFYLATKSAPVVSSAAGVGPSGSYLPSLPQVGDFGGGAGAGGGRIWYSIEPLGVAVHATATVAGVDLGLPGYLAVVAVGLAAIALAARRLRRGRGRRRR